MSLGATPYCQDSSLSRGAKTNHDEHHKDFTTHRYINGSGIDEKIGATAVTPEHGIRLGAYVRPQGQYSVFDGEAHGLEMAMEQLSNDTQLTPAAMHADNKGLAQSVTDPDALHKWTLRPVEIHWAPNHEGIPGNDEAAKLATG